MSLRPVRYRWLVYIAAAGATLIAMRWAPSMDGAAQRAVAALADPRTARDAPVHAATHAKAPPGHANALRLDALRARTLDPPRVNPFAARSWEGIAREEGSQRAGTTSDETASFASSAAPGTAASLPVPRPDGGGRHHRRVPRARGAQLHRAGRRGARRRLHRGVDRRRHLVLVYRPLDVRQTLAFGDPPAEATRPPPATPGGARSATRAEDEDEG